MFDNFRKIWDWFFKHPFTVIFFYLMFLLLLNIWFYKSYGNISPIRIVNIPEDKCVEIAETPFQIIIKPCHEKEKPSSPTSQ
jgi:hypothetical protein